MKYIVYSYIQKFKSSHRRTQKWAALLLVLALVVATAVFWRLHDTGIALTGEYVCGLTEHTHTEDCYEEVLVCGLEESEEHTHTDDCYETQLVCGLEEHVHTDACLSTEESVYDTTESEVDTESLLTGSVGTEEETEEQETAGAETVGSAAEEYLETIALLAEQAETLTGTEDADAWMIYNALLAILDEAEEDLAAGNLTQEEYDSIYDAIDEAIAGMEALGFDFSQIMVAATYTDDISIDIGGSTEVLGQSGGYNSFTLVDENGDDASDSFTIKYAYAPSTTITGSYYILNYLETTDSGSSVGAYFLTGTVSSNTLNMLFDASASFSDSYLVTSYAPGELTQWTIANDNDRYTMRSGNNSYLRANGNNVSLDNKNNATKLTISQLSGSSTFWIRYTNNSTTRNLNHYGNQSAAAFWETTSNSPKENEQWYFLSKYGLQLTGLESGIYTLTVNWSNGDTTTYTITVGGTASTKVVLNLGNGNGTNSNGDYVDGTSLSGTAALRYTVSIPGDFTASDGTVTINLPGDSDLATTTSTTNTFTVVNADASAGLSAVTVDLGKEQNYNYKLVGWINIATGEYYDVSGGSVTATVDTTKNNVFYADWVADESTLNYTNTEGLGIDTSAFVKINMFDYNELFNLYSANLTQSGLTSEIWSDSGSFYEDTIISLVANGTLNSTTALDRSFAFQNTRTYSSGTLGYLSGLCTWNTNINEHKVTGYWNIDTDAGSDVIQALYDTSGSTTGVHYLGSANYLFQIDSNGYYYFDADQNGAAYNQEQERFYLSSTKTTLSEGSSNYGAAFMPLNSIGSYTSISDGELNYWFGMSVEIEFYLPNTVGTSDGNQWNDANMTFEFSGDDDVWVFIDGELVLDLGGIHSEISGSIDFSTGEVLADSGNYQTKSSIEGMGAGTHTLTVYYMERGAWDSNMKMTFNMASLWEYETTPVTTMEVTKEWTDGEDAHTADSVTVGLYKRVEITDSETNSDGTVTYYYDTAETNNGSDNFTFEYDQYSVYTGVENLYMTPTVGSVDAYIADEDWNNGNPTYMYVLVDIQTLDATTYNGYSADDSRLENWSYAWGQLKYGAVFEIRELVGKSGYTSSITSTETITTYPYWSIAGSAELNGTITSTAGNSGYTYDGALEDGLAILITDAALYGTATTTLPIRYVGYSLVHTGSGDIDIEETNFSSAASALDTSEAYYSYGVTSDDNNNIPSNAYWYVQMTGEYRDTIIYVRTRSTTVSMTVTIPTFYLMTAESGGKYLAVVEDSSAASGYTLALVDSINEASAFAYNGNGELETIITVTDGNTTTEKQLKIVINHETETTTDGEGNTVTTLTSASWAVELRSGETDEDNVKIYIEQDTETTGYSYTITNSPTLSLVKVSSEADTNGNYPGLSGAEFALYKIVTEESTDSVSGETIYTDVKYYYSVTSEGIVTWSTEQTTLTTDDSGYITLTGVGDGTWYIEEITAPGGYSLIAGIIKMVVEDGEIVSAALLDSNGAEIADSDSVVSILASTVSGTDIDLTLQVKDTPGVELPSAGGIGRRPYVWMGLLLLCGGACILLYRRRRIAR